MAPKTAAPEPFPATAYSPEVRKFLRAHPALEREMPAIEAMIHAAYDRPEIKARVYDFAGSEEPIEPVLELVVWCREDRQTVRRKRRELLAGPWLEFPIDAIRHIVVHEFSKSD